MAAGDFQLAIRAVRPILNRHQARRHLLVVRRALDGIGNGGEEHIRQAGFHVLDGGFNVRQLLAFVAKHEEHAGLNSPVAAERDGLAHLLDFDAPLHGVENSLRAALRSDPHAEAAELSQRVRHARVEAVGARDALEGNAQAAALHLGGVFDHPAVVDGEDVVRHPGHVRLVSSHEPLELVYDGARLPAAVRLAENFVAAPAAMVGAAARRDQRD